MKVLPFKVPKTQNESFQSQIEDLPHFYGELHSHPEIQITYIKEGSGTLVAGDYISTFEPGKIYILGSNQPHVFRNTPEYFVEGSKLRVFGISIFINKDLFGKSFPGLPEISQLYDFFHRTERGMVLNSSVSHDVLPLILSFIDSQGFSKMTALFNLLDKLISTEGYAFLSSVATKKQFNSKDGERLNAIIQFTLAEYTRRINLEEVAEMASLTPHSFCRYFKMHTRKSYFSFLNEVRIGNARLLLQKNEQGIAQVAYSCGFNNLSNFNRIFKHLTGDTPKDFRKKMERVIG